MTFVVEPGYSCPLKSNAGRVFNIGWNPTVVDVTGRDECWTAKTGTTFHFEDCSSRCPAHPFDRTRTLATHVAAEAAVFRSDLSVADVAATDAAGQHVIWDSVVLCECNQYRFRVRCPCTTS